MYIFIAIIFIAELIIAINLIGLIVKADKKVCEINACVEVFNPLTETCMQYARCLSHQFKTSFDGFLSFFRKKQNEVFIKSALMISIYIMLAIFKIKKHRASKIYRLFDAIKDLAFDFV